MQTESDMDTDEHERIEQLTVEELRHILCTVIGWDVMLRQLSLCLTHQAHNHERCNECETAAEKLGMEIPKEYWGD